MTAAGSSFSSFKARSWRSRGPGPGLRPTGLSAGSRDRVGRRTRRRHVGRAGGAGTGAGRVGSVARGGRDRRRDPRPPASSATSCRDVQPVFTKLACNSGPRHGKQLAGTGTGFSFRSSGLTLGTSGLRRRLTKEARGRRVRVDRHAGLTASASRKPVGAVPHGGERPHLQGERAPSTACSAGGSPPGRRGAAERHRDLKNGSRSFRIAWVLRKGNSSNSSSARSMQPTGTTRDVTPLGSQFRVERGDGGRRPSMKVGFEIHRRLSHGAKSAVMAWYMDNFVVCRTSRPLAGERAGRVLPSLPRTNYIDEHVWTTLKRSASSPPAPASDHRSSGSGRRSTSSAGSRRRPGDRGVLAGLVAPDAGAARRSPRSTPSTLSTGQAKVGPTCPAQPVMRRDQGERSPLRQPDPRAFREQPPATTSSSANS